MNCRKCGAIIDRNNSFCVKCGAKVENATQEIPTVGNINPPTPNGGGNKGLMIALISVLGAILIAIIVFLICFLPSKGTDETTTNGGGTSKKADTFKNETEEKKNNKNLSEMLDNYIDEKGVSNSVAIAIIDDDDNIFTTRTANNQMPAWGFYLPIYLTLESYYPSSYSDLKSKVLSSDPGVCNFAANDAIDVFGGLSSFNSDMSNAFNTNVTYYGRYFGDTSSSQNNYTSAEEAAKFLNYFRENCQYSQMSYSPSGFGISTPSNASSYCQIGTENRNVKKYLNYFAVVDGNESEYVVAILTENNVGSGFISNALTFIHNEMEKREQDD